ncbi:MAG: hypothetical protein OQK45_05690 [Sulfurovum sp.]|nr:hypothetical protein [Sulfurovum sp.]
MKRPTLTIIFFLTFFSYLYAYDNNISASLDLNISIKESDGFVKHIPKKRKSSKSFYKKFKKLFSDYDGTLIEDMVTYSVDIVIPDEMMLATEDIINNRNDKGFGYPAKEIPKKLSNDAYSMMLTTAYYHFQDVARITEELWEDDACDPDTFTHDISKDPKEPLLNLKANDENARGVTKNGIVLPINDNFPTALYPFASRPDGCSAEGLQDVYDLANDFSDDEPWLREACNNHDRCYFTEGTSSKECNAQFIIEAVDSCNHISNEDTLLYMGMKNAFCGFKGLTVSSAANACADRYFAEAQRKQKAYNQWVIRYEESYLKAKQKKQ